jgi:hypothetical protein
MAGSTVQKGPTRRRVKLPTSGQWPRVGKIRLGTAEPTGRKTDWGQDIVRPQKADHFVVHADENGVTSEEAARAFAEAHGDAPTQLRFILPGDTPDACMEGAYRLYGANKLKIRCDGETCDERTQTGWRRDQPCICTAKSLAADSRDRCTLTYTIQLILPDVAVPGIWQLDTGSEISSRRMADWLDMVYTLRGGLLGVEGDLFLKAVSVQPEGMQKTTTVYVLSPQAREATVTQLLAGGGGVALGPGARAELPAPAADDEPEQTLDRGAFDETAAHPEDAADTAAESPQPDDVAGSDTDGPLTVAQQIRRLGDADTARLRERSLQWRAPLEEGGDPAPIKQTISGVAAYIEATYPGDSVVGLLDQLDAIADAGIPF